MKIASAFIILVLLGSLLDASAQGHPNRPPRPHPNPSPMPTPAPLPDYQETFPPHHNEFSQIISERVGQTLRFRETALVSQLMRLSRNEEMLEVKTIIIRAASSSWGQTSLDVLSQGRPVSMRPEVVDQQLRDIRVILPMRTLVADLELQASDEIFIDSITLELERQGGGMGHLRQASSGELIQLQVQGQSHRQNVIDLDQLAKIQDGITLEGAEIDRIVVRGISHGYGSASVQVELNGRLVGPARPLVGRAGGVPIPVKSMEPVRSLRLIINGLARIEQVNIVVGQVRPIHLGGQLIQIHQEVSRMRPLDLGRLVSRGNIVVSSLTLEASSHLGNGELTAISSRGEFLGRVMVSRYSSLVTLHLQRPTLLSEIRLESFSSVMVETIQIDPLQSRW